MAVEDDRQAMAMPSRRAQVVVAVAVVAAVVEEDHGDNVGPSRRMKAWNQVKEYDVRVHQGHIHWVR
jgi:hypothetical protein